MVLILVLVEDGLRGNLMTRRTSPTLVLILVLVEDGFRAAILRGAKIELVLILVLVEDGLRATNCWRSSQKRAEVLILVLVEDGLRELRSLGLFRTI